MDGQWSNLSEGIILRTCHPITIILAIILPATLTIILAVILAVTLLAVTLTLVPQEWSMELREAAAQQEAASRVIETATKAVAASAEARAAADSAAEVEAAVNAAVEQGECPLAASTGYPQAVHSFSPDDKHRLLPACSSRQHCACTACCLYLHRLQLPSRPPAACLHRLLPVPAPPATA